MIATPFFGHLAIFSEGFHKVVELPSHVKNDSLDIIAYLYTMSSTSVISLSVITKIPFKIRVFLDTDFNLLLLFLWTFFFCRIFYFRNKFSDYFIRF